MTWSSFFPPKKLYALDLKVKELDPAWPIVADPTAAQPAAIHVNPKFIKKTSAETPKTSQPVTAPTTTTSIQLTAEAAAERKKKESERQEMEMRQQLIKKQEQLLQLQQKRLEFELQQTQSKLEEQALELKQKNEQLLRQQQALQQQQVAAAAAAAWSGQPRPPLMWPGGPPLMPGQGGPTMMHANDASMMQQQKQQPFLPPPPIPPFNQPVPMPQQPQPPMQPVLPMQQVPPVQQAAKAAPVTRDPRIARDPRLARRDPRLRGVADPTPTVAASTAPTAPTIATVPPVQSTVQVPATSVAQPRPAPLATSNSVSQASASQQLKSVVTVAQSQPSKSTPKSPAKGGDDAKDSKAADSKQQTDQKQETKADTQALDKKDSKSEVKQKESKAESKSDAKPKVDTANKQEKSKEVKSSDRSPRRPSDEKRDSKSDSKARERSSREPERRPSRDFKKELDKRDSWSSRERDRDSREKDRDYRDRPKERVISRDSSSRLVNSRRRSNRSRSRSRSPVSRSRSPRGSDKSHTGMRKVDKFGRDLPRPAKETKEEKKPEPVSESRKKDVDDRVKSRRSSKENVPDAKDKPSQAKTEKRRSPTTTPSKEGNRGSESNEDAPSKRPRLDEETLLDKPPPPKKETEPKDEGSLPEDQSHPEHKPRPGDKPRSEDKPPHPEDKPHQEEKPRQEEKLQDGKKREEQPTLPKVARPLMELAPPRLFFEQGSWHRDYHPQDRFESGREMLSPPGGRRDRLPGRRRLSIDPNVHIPKELSLEKHAFILEQAEKQLHSGELTHEQHQELLRELFELHQIQRQRQDDEFIQRHPDDPHFRRHYSVDPRAPHDPKWHAHLRKGGSWPEDKDVDHRRFPVQDVDMRVFDPAHLMHAPTAKSRGIDPVKSEAKPSDSDQLELPSTDRDERKNSPLHKDRDDRVRASPPENKSALPAPPLKSILKPAKPMPLDSPLSPEPEEKRGNDSKVRTVGEAVLESLKKDANQPDKQEEPKTLAEDKASPVSDDTSNAASENNSPTVPSETEEAVKGKGKKKNKKKKKKGKGNGAEVHVEVTAFEENLEIKPPVISEKKIQPLMDMDERRNSTDNEPVNVLPAPFREADDLEDLFPAGKDRDERQGPGHPVSNQENAKRGGMQPREGHPVQIREGHSRDPRLRKGLPDGEPRNNLPRQDPLRDGILGRFPDGDTFREDLPRNHPCRERYPNELTREGPYRDGPVRGYPFKEGPLREPQGPPRDHLLRGSPPRDVPFRDGPQRDVLLRVSPRDGSFREGLAREGTFRDEHVRERSFRPEMDGPFREGPPRDGPRRDGPPGWGPYDDRPREGPLREGHPREGSFREVSFRDSPFREGHPREGPFREGHPREGPFREGPFREGHPREGPFREGHPREGPFREAHPREEPFRDGHPREGPIRDHQKEGHPREGLIRGHQEDPFRSGPPRDGSFRDDPRREGNFRESPPRDGSFSGRIPREGSFREGSFREGPFREGLMRDGPPRGSPPREGAFRDGPPDGDSFRGPRNDPYRDVPPGERPFGKHPFREGPPVEGPFRDGPPRVGSFRRSPPRDEQLREDPARPLPREGPHRELEKDWDPRHGPPRGPPGDPREERHLAPPQEMRPMSLRPGQTPPPVERLEGPGIGGPGLEQQMTNRDKRQPTHLDQRAAEHLPPNQLMTLPVEMQDKPPTLEPAVQLPRSQAQHPPSLNPVMSIPPGLGMPNLNILPFQLLAAQQAAVLQASRPSGPGLIPRSSIFQGVGLPLNAPRANIFSMQHLGGPMLAIPGQQQPILLPGMQGIPQQFPGSIRAVVRPNLEGQLLIDQRGFPVTHGLQPGQMAGPGVPNSALMVAPHVMRPDNPQGTPPLQPAAPLDINSLFAKLIGAGILPPTRSDSPVLPGTGTPPPAGAKEEAEPDESAEDLFVPELGLYPEELKCRYEGVINRIYTGTQCSSCGMRFVIDEMDRYRKHLDWHFRQNRRDKDGVKAVQNRKWFYEVNQWLDFEEINDIDEERSSFFEEMAVESRTDKDGVHCVAIDAAVDGDEMCSLCHEPFEQFFDEDEEVWKLKDAVRFNKRTYHPGCYEDAKDASMLETPTPGEEGLNSSSDVSMSPLSAYAQLKASTGLPPKSAEQSVDPQKDIKTEPSEQTTGQLQSTDLTVDLKKEIKSEVDTPTGHAPSTGQPVDPPKDSLNPQSVSTTLENTTTVQAVDPQKSQPNASTTEQSAGKLVDPQVSSQTSAETSAVKMETNSTDDSQQSAFVKEEVDQPMETAAVDELNNSIKKEQTDIGGDADVKTEPSVDPEVKMEVDVTVAEADGHPQDSAVMEKIEVGDPQPVKQEPMETSTEAPLPTETVIKQELVDTATAQPEAKWEANREVTSSAATTPEPEFSEQEPALVLGQSPEKSDTELTETQPVEKESMETLPTESVDPKPMEADPAIPSDKQEGASTEAQPATQGEKVESATAVPENPTPEIQQSQPESETPSTSQSETGTDSAGTETKPGTKSQLDTVEQSETKTPEVTSGLHNIQAISVIGTSRVDSQRRRDFYR